MSDIGRVVPMPVRRGARAAAATVSGAMNGAGAAARRLSDEAPGTVDDWGRDPALVRALMLAAQFRWGVTVGGDQHVPKRKGGLIVVNTRRYALAPIFTAFAISRAVDRPVRFVGRPDDAPVGAFARRIGALLDDADEVRGALRAGELVVLGAEPSPTPREVGRVDHFHVGAAVAAGVPVFPTATTSTPLTRRARVEIGGYVRSRHRRRGPLAELELADQIAEEIELLLDELGDLNTGWPFEQISFGGLGGS